MPSVSKSQQRLLGMAWAYATGELKLKEIPKEIQQTIKDIAKTMKKKDLSDFAHTTHEGLPDKKTTIINDILKSAFPMDRYDKSNSVEKIHGYYIPRPNETTEKTFDRAKNETINNIKQSLKNIENIDYATFLEILKKQGISIEND